MKKIWITLIGISVVILATNYFGCSGGSNPTAPGEDINRYVSVDVCAMCHVGVAAEWERTAHSRSTDDAIAGGHAGDHCWACMATGSDGVLANSGYDDPDPGIAERFKGVQCEACHGVGGRHIVDRAPLIKDYDAAMCGGCHEGARHGIYEEWEESGHAHAIDARDASSHFATHCLDCHSTDYRFADNVPEDATPYDFEFGITCADCHDPHDDTNAYQLRKPVIELCGECHTAGGSKPGSSPHHPHADVLQGTGGYEYPGSTYENTAHTYLADGCAGCHMWSQPYNSTGEGEAGIFGHTWEPLIEACQECHVGLETFDRGGTQTEIQGLLDELKAELDAATDNDKLTLSYDRANFNYKFVDSDGSLGTHNLKYVRALLQDSIDDFTPGS